MLGFYNPSRSVGAMNILQKLMPAWKRVIGLWITALLLTVCAVAQPTAAPAEPLSIATITLPRAALRREYSFRLEAHGGVAPLHWEVTSGALPEGINLDPDGLLHGTPAKIGDYHFTGTVSDSAKPAHQASHEFELRVVTPLLAEWSRLPQVSGNRIEGEIQVSNGTEHNFDLTVIIVAVNEIGRATALGYQHFHLKPDTTDLKIPFGETLPRSSYQVDADVVAEVLETHTIYRVHLSTSRLEVQQGP